MNRRSFLKFLPAGVLGAKHAAAEAAESLALGNSNMLSATGDGPYGNSIAPSAGGASWATRDLKNLLNPALLAERHANTAVRVLDPDLASMKSMALARRIDIQRDRNFERDVRCERSYLEKVISGFFD